MESSLSPLTKEIARESLLLVLLEELVEVIFSKLPTEDILRLKSVSKRCRDITIRRSFAKLHFENHPHSVYLLASGSLKSKDMSDSELAFKINLDERLMTAHWGRIGGLFRNMSFCQPLDGLICCHSIDHISIWNPTVGIDWPVPPITREQRGYEMIHTWGIRLVAFGKVSSRDHPAEYQVLVVGSSVALIFSVEQGSWVDLELTDDCVCMLTDFISRVDERISSIYINGANYWGIENQLNSYFLSYNFQLSRFESIVSPPRPERLCWTYAANYMGLLGRVEILHKSPSVWDVDYRTALDENLLYADAKGSDANVLILNEDAMEYSSIPSYDLIVDSADFALIWKDGDMIINDYHSYLRVIRSSGHIVDLELSPDEISNVALYLYTPTLLTPWPEERVEGGGGGPRGNDKEGGRGNGGRGSDERGRGGETREKKPEAKKGQTGDSSEMSKEVKTLLFNLDAAQPEDRPIEMIVRKLMVSQQVNESHLEFREGVHCSLVEDAFDLSVDIRLAKFLVQFRLLSRELNDCIAGFFLAYRRSVLCSSLYRIADPSLMLLPESVIIRNSCNGLLLFQGKDDENVYYMCSPTCKEFDELLIPTYFLGDEPEIVLAFEPLFEICVSESQVTGPIFVSGLMLYFEVYELRTRSWKCCPTGHGVKCYIFEMKDGFYTRGHVYWETLFGDYLVFDMRKDVTFTLSPFERTSSGSFSVSG